MKTKPSIEITLHDREPELPEVPDMSGDYAISTRPHLDLEAFSYTREELEEAVRNSTPLDPRRRRAHVAGVGKVGPAFDTLEIEVRWETGFERNLRLAQGAGGEGFARRFAAASKAFQEEDPPFRIPFDWRLGGRVARPPIHSIGSAPPEVDDG
jgi:hypothetical protein